jgi:hemerythrin-like domain-containing protein
VGLRAHTPCMEGFQFPTPAAGFDSPLEILDGCHARVRRNCDLIERIAEHIEDEGLDDEVRAAASSVLRYFDTAGRDHHRDEEEDLFPALLKAAGSGARASVQSMIDRLRADHERLEALWAAIRLQLEAVRDGRGGAVDLALARALSQAYDDHIVEEERVLLPLARQLLSPATLATLGASMAARRSVKK